MLVMVLFVMSVLGMCALSFTYRAALQSREARGAVIRIQLEEHARSAAEIAIARLRENTNDFDHLAEAWHAHARLCDEDWLPEWSAASPGKEPVFWTEYFVMDEEGKLNLSIASSDVLEKLGMNSAQIACLLDWMDSDDQPRSSGAESDFYAALPYPYACKNAPVQTLDELALIRGFGPESYMGDDIRLALEGTPASNLEDARLGWVSLVTCHGEGAININTAPKQVLQSLPISEEAVGQILGYRRFDDYSGGKLEEHAFRSAKDIEQLNGLSEADRDVLKAIACFRSSTFRIFVRSAHRPSGQCVLLEALVRVDGQNVSVLQWKM